MSTFTADRQEQAVDHYQWFAAPLMPASRMLSFLGPECRALRLKAGIKAIHVAARLDSSEAKVTRFEKGQTQPDDLDGMITAFADELQIEATVIWQRALKAWLAAPDEIPVLEPDEAGADRATGRGPRLRRPASTPEAKPARRNRRAAS